jgi:hypothetical protein
MMRGKAGRVVCLDGLKVGGFAFTDLEGKLLSALTPATFWFFVQHSEELPESMRRHVLYLFKKREAHEPAACAAREAQRARQRAEGQRRREAELAWLRAEDQRRREAVCGIRKEHDVIGMDALHDEAVREDQRRWREEAVRNAWDAHRAVRAVADPLLREVIQAGRRAMAMKHHPGRGGDPARMAEINTVVDRALGRAVR